MIAHITRARATLAAAVAGADLAGDGRRAVGCNVPNQCAAGFTLCVRFARLTILIAAAVIARETRAEASLALAFTTLAITVSGTD